MRSACSVVMRSSAGGIMRSNGISSVVTGTLDFALTLSPASGDSKSPSLKSFVGIHRVSQIVYLNAAVMALFDALSDESMPSPTVTTGTEEPSDAYHVCRTLKDTRIDVLASPFRLNVCRSWDSF